MASKEEIKVKSRTNTKILAQRLLSGKKVAQKPLKTPVSMSKPHITEFICAECGQKIGVVDGSKCWHCGCVMDNVIKRRRK